jgi:hypothetical protein
VGVVNKSEEAGVRTAEPSRSHGQDVGGVPTSLSLEIFSFFFSCFVVVISKIKFRTTLQTGERRNTTTTIFKRYGVSVRCHGERNDDTFKGVPEGSCCDKRSRLGS